MTLAEKSAWKNVNEKVQATFAKVTKLLGTEVSYEIAQESFSDPAIKKEDVATFAWAAGEALENVILKGADEKNAVQAGVKSVKIAYGEPAYKLDGTTLLFTTDLGKTDNAASVRNALTDWIMNTL